MDENQLNNRENDEEEVYILEEMDVALADAMQAPNNRDSDGELSDSDGEENHNIPNPVWNILF